MKSTEHDSIEVIAHGSVIPQHLVYEGADGVSCQGRVVAWVHYEEKREYTGLDPVVERDGHLSVVEWVKGCSLASGAEGHGCHHGGE